MGFKIDPKHQEAFTDAGRSAYEKQSGLVTKNSHLRALTFHLDLRGREVD